jgi:hypothetical protein
MMRIWNRLAGEPWAITETALAYHFEIAARENESPQAVAAKLGRNLQNTYSVTERDGCGDHSRDRAAFPLCQSVHAVSGASSYELIARDFTAALENPQIKGIILDIDSPGGEVNGVSEFSNMVYAARGKKPVVAYASGDAHPVHIGLPPPLMKSWSQKHRRWDQSAWSACIAANQENQAKM